VRRGLMPPSSSSLLHHRPTISCWVQPSRSDLTIIRIVALRWNPAAFSSDEPQLKKIREPKKTIKVTVKGPSAPTAPVAFLTAHPLREEKSFLLI